jgi:zinc protease
VSVIVERLFGAWQGEPTGRTASAAAIDDRGRARPRFIRVLHRPGSVQTEIRIGHVGVPRRIPDFHALSVTGAILGGLFNSRLNMKLREEKGYTYGAGAGFDLRRGAGPFSARAAVNTEVTVPAVADFLDELDRIRESPVQAAELAAARDYLIGVFPLRFETPGPVVGALAGLFVHDLPDDELATYRPSIEAVTIEAVQVAARSRIDPDHAAIVLVGDVEAFGGPLEAAGFGPVEVERESEPIDPGRDDGVQHVLEPLDEGPEGPTGGAKEPVEDGLEDPTGTDDEDRDGH